MHALMIVREKDKDARYCAYPLLDFKTTTVGLLGRLLWTSRDTSIGLFVVESFRNRVTLKDPSIFTFLPSTVMMSLVADCLRNRLRGSPGHNW